MKYKRTGLHTLVGDASAKTGHTISADTQELRHGLPLLRAARHVWAASSPQQLTHSPKHIADVTADSKAPGWLRWL